MLNLNDKQTEDLKIRFLNVPNAYFETYHVDSFIVQMLKVRFCEGLTLQQKKRLYASEIIDVAVMNSDHALINIDALEFTKLSGLNEKLKNLKQDLQSQLSECIDYEGPIEITGIILDPFNQVDEECDFVDIDFTMNSKFFEVLSDQKKWIFKGIVFGNDFETAFDPLALDSMEGLSTVIQELATVTWMKMDRSSVIVETIE